MIEAILTLILATALLLGSPGPAPLALAATGASFGISRGLPFLCGVIAGLGAAAIGSVLGIALLFSTYPAIKLWVQIAGGLYIVYVAYKIATAPILTKEFDNSHQVPGFADGFILNLLNPKAYAAFLAVFAQFTLPLASPSWALLVTAIIALAVGAVVDVLWLYFGGVIGRLFKHERQARMLRITFAILMLLAVLWAFSQ